MGYMTIKRLLLAGSVGLAAAGFFAMVASASCIAMTSAEQRARADVIFNGVALEGPTATGVQKFRVTRYLKSSGPVIVRVRTGTVRRPDGTGSTTSVSLLVRRGAKWRIFGRGRVTRVISSNVCDGSRRL